jgi:hypothetical protein
LIAESGPQPYTAFIQKLKLQTGTLNHHLQKLSGLIEQDGSRAYRLTGDGNAAYQSTLNAERFISSRQLPPLRRQELPQLVEAYLQAFWKVFLRPIDAFREARARHATYFLVCLTLLAVLYPILLVANRSEALNLSILLVAWILFSAVFLRVVYRSRVGIIETGLCVGLSTGPYIPLAALNFLPVSANGVISFPATLPLENPLQIGLAQLQSLLFIWRFALLFLGMRELCGLSNVRSFTVVLVTSIFESIVALSLGSLTVT